MDETKAFIEWLYTDYAVFKRGERGILFKEQVLKLVDRYRVEGKRERGGKARGKGQL
jgi:hypothetical protein